MSRIRLIPFFLLLASCASTPQNNPTATDAGQAFDLASTGAAISGGAVEANPGMATAFSNPISAVVVSAGKVAAPHLAKNLDKPECQAIRSSLNGAGYGAGVWNLGIIAGAGTGVGLPAAGLAYLVAHQLTMRDDQCPEHFSTMPDGGINSIRATELVVMGDVIYGDEIYWFTAGESVKPWSPVSHIHTEDGSITLTTEAGWTLTQPFERKISVRRVQTL